MSRQGRQERLERAKARMVAALHVDWDAPRLEDMSEPERRAWLTERAAAELELFAAQQALLRRDRSASPGAHQLRRSPDLYTGDCPVCGRTQIIPRDNMGATWRNDRFGFAVPCPGCERTAEARRDAGEASLRPSTPDEVHSPASAPQEALR